MRDRSRVVHRSLTGPLLFAGFYVLFYGELPPHLLFAGVAIAGVEMLAFGGTKAWAMVLGIPVAFFRRVLAQYHRRVASTSGPGLAPVHPSA